MGEEADQRSRAKDTRVLCALALLVLAALVTLPAHGQACTPVVARLVSQQGSIDIQRAGTTTWAPAPLAAVFCPGDAVRLGERARAAMRLANQSTLRLDQNTTLVLSPAESPGSLDLLRGAINVITRTPRPFKVRTPFINAGVEGTEFLVRVGADSGQILVFEGRVLADNASGEVRLGAGDGAVAVTGKAPQPGLVIRPADAVQWTLYYPGVIGAREADPPSVRDAITLARRGEVDAALARLPAAPSDGHKRSGALRAELLLMVGRVDEARAEIASTLETEPASADARAVQALIAVAQNDVAAALALATSAVALDPGSVAARVALSYAEQARFDIPAALAAALQAVALAPDAALPHSRAAELQLASGQLADAVESARRAVRLDAGSSRAQAVLGFAQLTQTRTAEARQSFAAAIERDPADYLPRLGFGLALIRDGELAAGREAIEIAVALDPLNSLARSYLGKAYFEEKRDKQAGVQFELGKSLDPNDPTPWFYDAIRLQAENRPVEALEQMERSIALNDNRAVVRSRFLLDQDRATRQVGLASVYTDLGSDREAIVLASRSLDEDPSNTTAHRFLSDAYASRERYDIARTSELLQSQLLAPLGLNTTSPELPFTSLGLPRSSLQSTPFAFDATSVFERDQVRGWAALLAGNRDTRGARAVVSGMSGPISASVGVFDFRTDGFRPNSDIAHTILNAFLQAALSPTLMLQAELRDRTTRQGDIEQRFDPQDMLPSLRRQIDEHFSRIGATWRPGPDTVWLASASGGRRGDAQTVSLEGFTDLALAFEDKAAHYELQMQQRTRLGSFVAGVGKGRLDTTTAVDFDFTKTRGERCPPDAGTCSSVDRHKVSESNAYLYWNIEPWHNLSATLGLAREHYDDRTSVRVARWQPKLGLRWEASPSVTWRAAAFSTVKRSYLNQQTIEPTQVAGFNQFYDAVDGTIMRTVALATDVKATPTLTFGAEAGRQKMRVGSGFEGSELDTVPEQVQRFDWVRLDATSRALSALIASIGLKAERFRADPETQQPGLPTKVMTTQLPLALRSYSQAGYFGEVVTTAVWQKVERLPDSGSQGSSRFVVVDASLGWRLPDRRGTLSLDVKNLFGRKFAYQDDNFASTELRPATFQPVRRWWVKASLAF